ncbi:MAG TPA: hypothetical protein PLT49_04385, partial [Ferruginibacter sp.]|nr:hypothetical protein [Ferruginibacter sp.]
KIIDERNTVIETFTTDENGYARIRIEPENKKVYFIHAEEKVTGATVKKKLPALRESGVSLSVYTRPDSISYTVYSFTTDNNLLNYTLHILSKERVIYKSDISFQPTLSLVKESIALKDLAAGFLTLRLTDAKNNIAAQRIIYTPAGTGTMLTIIDTISGKSARVELPAYVSGLSYVNIRANNRLALDDGFMQAVLQPSDQPIVSNSAGEADRLNDWLISTTNGSPAPVTKASTVSPFLSLTGIAYNKYKKPLRDEKLNLIFVHSNQRKEYLVTKTDKNGKFSADGLVFFDTVSVYYQLADHSEEKNEITVELSVSPDLSVTGNEARAAQLACTVTLAIPDTLEAAKDNGSSEPPRKDQKTLKEVSVKTYKAPPKTNTQKFIEENVSGQHNQAAFLRDEIDLIAHPQTIDTRPLFEFLRGRMASVQVTISTRGEVKLNTTGGAPIGVYLDDMEVTQDLDMVTNLRVSDVALVRYYGMPLKPRLEGTKTKYSGFFGTGNGGGGGDLMIYTKKGFVPTEQMTRGLSRIRITGYSTDMPVKSAVPLPGSARSVYWKPNWQIAGPQTIFIGLSADDLKNTCLLIEGLNNDLDLFSFRKNLVFN